MKNIFKFFSLLILVLNFNQSTNAKPLPPGSGEGDVPANILILLDSSASMRSSIIDATPDSSSIAIDGNGNRVLSSSSWKVGGLRFFNSAGERTNVTHNGAVRTGWMPHHVTNKCRWGLYPNQWGGGVSSNPRRNIAWNQKALGEVKYVTGVTIPGTDINNENLLFVGQWEFGNQRNKPVIFALDNNYNCRLVIQPGMLSIRGFDISNNQNGDLGIGIFGRDGRNVSGGKTNAYHMYCQFNQGKCNFSVGTGKNRNDVWGRIWDGVRYKLNSDSTEVYITDDGNIYGYTTTLRVYGGGRIENVITSSSNQFRFCRGNGPIGNLRYFEISDSDDDVMFATGNSKRIHRIEWTGNTCNATVTGGKNGTLGNTADAGTLAADDIIIQKNPTALSLSGGSIFISNNGYADEISENLYTVAGQDTAWQQQFGGPALSRIDGAKNAIRSLLTDTTLTSGANFGFGHWNAGETPGRWSRRGGRYCHSNNPCNYYGGWDGAHPDGQSRICTGDSCLNVAISPEGAADAIPILESLGLEWGTDSEAFSQIAHDYFFGPVSPHDPNSDCQLNYVIIIGDGEMKKTGTSSSRFRGRTADRLTRLRTELGVKTLMVAYGNGISAKGMRLFDELAVVGSCDTAGGTDCEETIVAATPQELQTSLQQKIRQILAERLAFTAPSITATIQQGGSLYQAQFGYEQFGEWQGTILRKTLNPDGTVEHDITAPGNWDAAVQVRAQSSGGPDDPSTNDSRNIWTPIADQSLNYIGNWDNVSDTTAPILEQEMTRLGFELSNYHFSSVNSESSNCGGDNTTDDERDGLLRFLAGQDFFDYDGDCNTTELRSHVLGDIYHSQLIEIGAPDGNTQFTDNNQEAYFRSIKNYQSFRSLHQNRRNVLYAGSNSGLLHAFNAETGDEEWAFLPPFMVGKLPTIINASLDGQIGGSKGGSSAIFGVDGSPVVHDVFMRGLTPEGNIEGSASWHTILFQPFGRGGSGFSVLDVTNPIVKDGIGPLHMFTVYNDYINQVVYIMDHTGEIRAEGYTSSSSSLALSEEGLQAQSNLNAAIEADGGVDLDPPVTTQQDLIATCQSNDDATTNFRTDGTNSCYIGKTFTFNNIFFDTPNNTAIDPDMINVSELVGGEFVPIEFNDARMVNGEFVITFSEDKIHNPGGSANETRESNNIFIQTSCTANTGIDPFFDYSKLGETWSTPKIVKLPSDIEGERSDPANDKYVAIMGAGMANNNLCAGSALFMVELDNLEEPGKIYGGDQNGGPITIIDTSPEGVALGNDVIATPNGSDINNAVPTSPLVITPDTAFGIPWRGAMVYINDREGKITKINLTDSTVNDARLFDQTTLFRLNANTTNQRYTFFSMDAGVGVTTKDFWLFGGTGDFNKLGEVNRNMDNILYGVRDFDYPYFKHLNGVTIPSFTDQAFTSLAHQGADNARSIDDATVCSDVTGDTDGTLCPDAESAWVIHLDTPGDNNTHRKASAPPTLFKGQVYFPVYEPPPGTNRCNIGNAYICVADDECGTNNSHKLVKGGEANGSNCTFVREGVLSELVIFGDKLFANVAGPSENPDTLYSVIAVPGEVLSNRGGWRDTGY